MMVLQWHFAMNRPREQKSEDGGEDPGNWMKRKLGCHKKLKMLECETKSN